MSRGFKPAGIDGDDVAKAVAVKIRSRHTSRSYANAINDRTRKCAMA